MTNQTFIFPSIYAIVNINDEGDEISLIEKILKAKISLIQIRDKFGPREKTLDISLKALALRDRIMPNAKIIINDFPEVCLSTKADGVHLGQNDSDLKTTRLILGNEYIIGLSCHNLRDIEDGLIKSKKYTLNYLALGPIFPSITKQGHADVVGTSLLKEASILSTIPIVAIGGITEDNANSIFESGAKSCAMIETIKTCQDLIILKNNFDKIRDSYSLI